MLFFIIKSGLMERSLTHVKQNSVWIAHSPHSPLQNMISSPSFLKLRSTSFFFVFSNDGVSFFRISNTVFLITAEILSLRQHQNGFYLLFLRMGTHDVISQICHVCHMFNLM